MIRKIIESHKMLIVCIILYLGMFFACKLGYEMASVVSVGTPIYTGKELR